MGDINLEYIRNNIKTDKNLSINENNSKFDQYVFTKCSDESSTLLHKIYLDITNNKSINLTEILTKNTQLVNEIKESHNIKKCNVGEIMDIPKKLSDLLKNPESYYKFGVNFNNSYINSILIIFDKSYMSLTSNLQLTYIKE